LGHRPWKRRRIADIALDSGELPLKCPKLGEPAVVTLISGENPYAYTSGAHGDQCVVGKPTPSYLFVTVFGRQPRQYSTGVGPIAQIGHQDPSRPAKISFQSLYHAPLPLTSAGVEFLEHNRTQPQWRVIGYLPQHKSRIVSPSQRSYIQRSVEQCGVHLSNQRSIHVLNLNAALDKTLGGLENQAVLLVFRNCEVQSTLDGFGFCPRLQRSLGPLDLG
jgi:hypothetical protein